VLASDISAAMVSEAQRQAQLAQAAGSPEFRMPRFEVRDLESLDGRYDIVVCLDVLIHYPREEAQKMIRHLASLAEKRLVISFAPKTVYFDILKRVGELSHHVRIRLMRRKEIGHGRGREEILEELRHFRGDEGKDLEAVHLYRPARSADKRLVLAREKVETACTAMIRGDDCRGACVGKYLPCGVVGFVHQRRLDVAIDDEHFPAHVGREAACEVERVRIGAACHLDIKRRDRRRKPERSRDANGERRKPLRIRECRRDNCDDIVCADCARRLYGEVCERFAEADSRGDALYHDLGNGNHIRMSSRFGIFV
jgi:hypothetical protein